MTEESLDLRRTLAVLRRRSLAVLALFAVGLTCGVAAILLQPLRYVARSGVLLPPSAQDAQGRPLRNIETQVSIAGSAEILGRAGRALRPPASPTALRRRVDVRAVSVDILEIRAEAATPRDAALLANAIANEYVAYSSDASSDLAGTSVALLQDQAARLEERIRQLDADIADNTARLARLNPLSPEAARQAVLLDSLRVSQVDASRQLSSINSRIADARLEAELTRRGLRVLEPATRPRHPSRPRLVLSAGVGGTAGLLAGAVLALVLERGDHRLRRRDEIADAVGAPVLASLAVGPRKRVKEYGDLLTRWLPSAVETLAMRQAFARMGVADEEPPTNVIVVTLPGDRAALSLAVELAASAVSFGTPTALVVATAHAAVRELRSACAVVTRGDGEARPHLWVYGAIAGVEASDLARVELTVTIVVADDGPSALPVWGRQTYTALAVSSGFATAETLASTALAWLDSGHPVGGILVANPEPADPTIGQLGLTSRVSSDGRMARRPREHPRSAVTSEPVGQVT